MVASGFHGIFSALGQGKASTARKDDVAQDARSVGKVAVDIFEQDDYIIIKAPIAGVRMSDLDIEVNENILTIRGTRKQTDNIPDNQYYLQECFWGPFERRVTLPSAVDPRKVRATFSKDGVLKVLVPKEEKVKIVKISEA